MPKKEAAPIPTEQPAPVAESDGSLATISMVLGIVSLTGPGLLFGIPAIILAVIALKKQQPNRGMSLTGLVTGIISTTVSLLLILLMLFVFIWAVNNPVPIEQYDHLRHSPHTHVDSLPL